LNNFPRVRNSPAIPESCPSALSLMFNVLFCPRGELSGRRTGLVGNFSFSLTSSKMENGELTLSSSLFHLLSSKMENGELTLSSSRCHYLVHECLKVWSFFRYGCF
jgi:hypothetical protein